MKKLLIKFMNWRGYYPFGLFYAFGAGLIAAAVPFGWFKVIIILLVLVLGGIWAIADFNKWYEKLK